VALPHRGSKAVYLPQAHLAAGSGRGELAVALPPHVACRVVDIELCVSGEAPFLLTLSLPIRASCGGSAPMPARRLCSDAREIAVAPGEGARAAAALGGEARAAGEGTGGADGRERGGADGDSWEVSSGPG
jgi:hypothetical protein